MLPHRFPTQFTITLDWGYNLKIKNEYEEIHKLIMASVRAHNRMLIVFLFLVDELPDNRTSWMKTMLAKYFPPILLLLWGNPLVRWKCHQTILMLNFRILSSFQPFCKISIDGRLSADKIGLSPTACTESCYMYISACNKFWKWLRRLKSASLSMKGRKPSVYMSLLCSFLLIIYFCSLIAY